VSESRAGHLQPRGAQAKQLCFELRAMKKFPGRNLDRIADDHPIHGILQCFDSLRDIAHVGDFIQRINQNRDAGATALHNSVSRTISIARRIVLFVWALGSITVTSLWARRRKISMSSPSGSAPNSTKVTFSRYVVLNVRL
jgi:hypothetical protein